MSGFQFCSGTIFKNCLRSRDTTRDITVKKIFYKILKNYRSTERSQKTDHFQ